MRTYLWDHRKRVKQRRDDGFKKTQMASNDCRCLRKRRQCRGREEREIYSSIVYTAVIYTVVIHAPLTKAVPSFTLFAIIFSFSMLPIFVHDNSFLMRQGLNPDCQILKQTVYQWTTVVYFDQQSKGSRHSFHFFQYSHFQRFCCKNPKKARNLQQILAKNSFFFSLHQNAGQLIFNKIVSDSLLFTGQNVYL